MTKNLYRISGLCARIDEAIRAELSRAAPSAWRVMRLRTLRLALRDRWSRHANAAVMTA